MRYDDFLLVYNAGPEATYKLLLSIMENSLKQSAQISRLENRVKELEERANRNCLFRRTRPVNPVKSGHLVKCFQSIKDQVG